MDEHQNCENVLVEDQIQENVMLCQQKHRTKLKFENEFTKKKIQFELDLTNLLTYM